ncbi:MAG: hypothetical protein DMF94_16455, partial [Acidobacteria bacterium]
MTDPQSHAIAYMPGRRTSVTFPNGGVTSYGYDAANRLTSLAFTNGGTR